MSLSIAPFSSQNDIPLLQDGCAEPSPSSDIIPFLLIWVKCAAIPADLLLLLTDIKSVSLTASEYRPPVSSETQPGSILLGPSASQRVDNVAFYL